MPPPGSSVPALDDDYTLGSQSPSIAGVVDMREFTCWRCQDAAVVQSDLCERCYEEWKLLKEP